MKTNHDIQRKWTRITALSAVVLIIGAAQTMASSTGARELYNQGVEKLTTVHLKEAEGALLKALRTNDDEVRPLALYNLGHVRFLQGKETLKGEGNSAQAIDNADRIAAVAEEAIRQGESALESDNINQLIQAYFQGRAARRELRRANDELTRQLDLIAAVLMRWRRSVGDFRGSDEIFTSADATFNADVVERHIAELLKSKKPLEDAQSKTEGQRSKLNELMKKLGAKIPEGMKGGDDDEESDDDESGGSAPGKAGKPGKQGQNTGGEQEMSEDMLEIMKEKIKSRTMSVGQKEKRQTPLIPGGEKPKKPDDKPKQEY